MYNLAHIFEIFSALFKELFIRSKESVFWLVLFPTLLFLILTSIFGNVGENISLKVKILGKSEILKDVFTSIKQFEAEFVENSNIEVLKEELKNGKINAFVVLPKDFDSRFGLANLLRNTRLMRKLDIEIYYVPVRQESQIAADILNGVFSSIGGSERIEYAVHKLNATQFNYNYFIYPGVIGMAILSAFLFGFLDILTYTHRRGIVKRLYLTPTSLITLYTLIGLICMIVLVIGLIVLSFVAQLKGVQVMRYVPTMLIHVSMAAAVMISMAMAILTVSKNTSRLFIFEQIFFQVQMFVGGFYFPLKQANHIVRSIAQFLPITYTVDALRKVDGFEAFQNHLLVPTLYIFFFALIVVLNRKRLSVGV